MSVTTIYKKPRPIEIELSLKEDEMETVLDQINRAPAGELVEFHFILSSETKYLTVSAQVEA